MSTIFYKPDDAWAADFIPFFKDGRYHLFYLKDWRNIKTYGEGTPWFQISTLDFVTFTEHGQMLTRGTKDDQDLYVFTGSVTEGLGQYHIFYTGHNPYFRGQNKPEQGVMHAVSDDLINWRKVPGDTFYAPQDRFEMHDWRDPFVFWNSEAGEYWMLLAARLRSGPSRRRGCTALAVSKDLKSWEVRDHLYTPGLYYTHECPDLFKMGEWWYLLFSEFSERLVTRYRMARSLSGPWITPDDDQFDGRAFYAAKTASDGTHRFLFGWNPTREGAKDDGAWHWGGSLVVHEVLQRSDGTLSVRMPQSIAEAFGQPHSVNLKGGLGDWRVNSDGSGTLTAVGSFGCAVSDAMPDRCKIDLNLTFDTQARNGGVMLRASEDMEKAYYIRLEPKHQRLVFDLWPRPGDRPFMPELERPIPIQAGKPVAVRVLVENSICEVYIDEQCAMSTRLYDLPTGKWGVFVEGGSAVFDHIRIAE